MLDWIDGQPVSRRFGDVYFSRTSGAGETAHVFLRGNDLPARFSALGPGECFVIGETGFGTGLNFVAAWSLFGESAPASARLHFASTELEPLAHGDMARALSVWPRFEREAAQLLAQWQPLPPAFHRFVFDGGRVILTLLAGDARETLPAFDADVDAWFLDGFAPSRNPELWGQDVIGQVSRLSRAGATCATYTVAGSVRRELAAAGFEVDKAPGFGTKREMLKGRCAAPKAAGYRPPWHRRPPPLPDARSALVIGAGLAGAAAARSLAERGFSVVVADRAGTPAAGASGNPQGMLYIKPSAHGTPLTALSLSGLAFTRRWLAANLPADGNAWSPCGVLSLATDREETALQAKLAALGWPGGFVRPVDVLEATSIAGAEMPAGGLFYGTAGWVHPPSLVATQLTHPGIEWRPHLDVHDLGRTEEGRWIATSRSGDRAEADLVVVAAALDASAIPALSHLPAKAIRGQITQIVATPASRALATVVCGESYVAPARRGTHCIGATFGVGERDDDVRASEHRDNLEALARLAPSVAGALGIATLDPALLPGRAGVRCVTPDYLPIVGAAPDASEFVSRFAGLGKDATTKFEAAAPWHAGLYVTVGHGSRGLVSAPLAGELLASLATGEPLPLPRTVADALGAARFLVRGLRRGQPIRLASER